MLLIHILVLSFLRLVIKYIIYIYIYIAHFAGAIVGCFLLRKYGVFLTSHHTKCQNFDKDIEKMMEESTQRAIGFIPTNTVFLTETATQEVRVPATIQRDAQNMELGDYAPPTFIIQDV